MRTLPFVLLLCGCAGLWAQTPPPAPSPPGAHPQESESKSPPAPGPNLAPPRSDKIDASALENGESSSKDTQIDISPPADDVRTHPNGSEILTDEGSSSNSADVSEFHPWDPHRAAKDIEVGDFYFKNKNYRAAESRYREALYYKDNDAMATYHLAICLEKMDRPDDAKAEYQRYLKILPHGPEAENAKKAIDRLKSRPESKAQK